MKKRLPTFLSGMLTAALIGGLGVTALAATGQMTITVDPVNIQVNGQTFHPKDAKGDDVPVFAYNGTTYAPLRALAEAYGLTVGYDQEANMATVGDPATDTPAPDTTATTYSDWTDEEEAAYQEFKGMWNHNFTGAVERVPLATGGYDDTLWERHDFTFSGGADYTYIELDRVLVQARRDGFIHRLALEVRTSSNVTDIALFFADEAHPSAYGEVWHKLWIEL